MKKLTLYLILLTGCATVDPEIDSRRLDLLWYRQTAICSKLYRVADLISEDKIGLQMIQTKWDDSNVSTKLESLSQLTNEMYGIMFILEQRRQNR